MKAYQELHRENPTRELYVLHTNRKNLNIKKMCRCKAIVKRLDLLQQIKAINNMEKLTIGPIGRQVEMIILYLPFNLYVLTYKVS